MTELMRAAVVYGPGDVRVESVPVPAVKDGEVLVKVTAAGICTTDLKILRGEGNLRHRPGILGHEVAGEVAAAGRSASGYEAGQRVAVYPIAVCGECFYCRRGRHNLCEKEYGLGHGIDGGFAQYVRIPEEIVRLGGLVPLPAGLSDELAALAEPLSCCLAAARAAHTSPGDTVLVVGAGPMGLMHLLVCRWRGAVVAVVDPNGRRLAKAEELGAAACFDPGRCDVIGEVRRLTGGRGADQVISAVGDPEVAAGYFGALRPGGFFNVFGGPPAGRPVKVDLRWLHYSEAVLTGTFASTPDDFRLAVGLIAGGCIDAGALVTHRFGLDDFLEAVRLARDGTMLKGVILMDG